MHSTVSFFEYFSLLSRLFYRNQLLLDSNFPNLDMVASDYIIDTNLTLYKNFLGNFSQSYIDKVVDGLKNCSIQQELDQVC